MYKIHLHYFFIKRLKLKCIKYFVIENVKNLIPNVWTFNTG